VHVIIIAKVEILANTFFATSSLDTAYETSQIKQNTNINLQCVP